MKHDSVINHPADCRFLVGTSGYSYTEWIDAGFYPPGTRSGQMLGIYAQHFSTNELNYTWYQMPKAEAIERQRTLVPQTFEFTAKLTRTLTHEIDPENWKDQARAYRDGITPLLQARQLAAVLIQFPPQFRRSPDNRRHLAALLDALYGLPLAVEFRHRSWAVDRVFAELEHRKITLVTVDGPKLSNLFPLLDVVTNPDLLYIRFHGRNAASWYSGNMQLQFDYRYTENELRQRLDETLVPMSKQARKGVLFFNNHVRAQAADNARELIQLLSK